MIGEVFLCSAMEYYCCVFQVIFLSSEKKPKNVKRVRFDRMSSHNQMIERLKI